VAASLELVHVSPLVSVPIAAAGVTALVLRSGFHRVEHVLLALSAVFAAYVVAGVLAQPDWSAAARGLVVPSVPGTRDGVLAVVAVIGTTLAPWGLAFIGSYAADKHVPVEELGYERADVVIGSVLTGVIGLFVIVACAATLHGRPIDDAGDAAAALEPLAGSAASALFGVGLLGAALLAASVVPLSTAYSVAEAAGQPSRLDDGWAQARLFYVSYAAVATVAAALVLIPGAPLIDILYLTQALNAILLLPLLWVMRRIARDRALMGAHALSGTGAVLTGLALAGIAGCVIALAWLSL
jgi:Mn2+/Fe2+ NRAMP family transporter